MALRVTALLVRGARRVLLIEDDPDSREGLSELLRAWGFEVDGAADAEAALEVVLLHHPDIVVTDLSPPDGEPGDFIARVRAKLPGAFIVVYSGRDGFEEAARQAGANAFVTKPDVESLERLLGELG